MLANSTWLFHRDCVLFSLVVTFGLVVSVARLLPSQQAKLLFLDASEPLNTYCSPVSHCCEHCGRSEHMLRSLALLPSFFLFLFLVSFSIFPVVLLPTVRMKTECSLANDQRAAS